MTALLTTSDLTCRFAGLTAVDSVSVSVSEGSIHGLIGPNGAGKTTLFNLISGLQNPTFGTIAFDGQRIDALSIWQRSRMGLGRTFQNLRLFKEMTVLENVMTGAHRRVSVTPATILAGVWGVSQPERAAAEEARALLEFVGLGAMAEHPAGDLSYGDQRRVEIARALAGQPRLILLDEPAAGLNPAETTALGDLLRQLPGRGVTLLVVEHDMRFVMGLCDRISVLNFGRLIAEGSPAEIRTDRDVIDAYLGRSGATGR